MKADLYAMVLIVSVYVLGSLAFYMACAELWK